MTLSTTDNRISFAGNGATTAFATGFKFFANGDLTVTLVTDSTGAEVVKTITTHYTVAGAGVDSGGTVTMITAPASGETLVIERTQALTQGLDLVENDPFPSDSVEQQFDKNVIMAQQNNSAIARSLRQPDGDTADIDRLPPKVTRATKVLAFDADGDPVVSTETLADIEGAATSATAAAASAAAASTSETNASASETAAAASAAQALAAAQGFAAVTTVTTGTTNIETTDARTYYIIDASGGTVTINLPAIGANDGLFFAFDVSNADNAITIARDGTDQINGAGADYTSLTTVGDLVYFVADDATPDNWLATLMSRVPAASTTVAGKVELATDAEVATGTDTARAVTPASAAAHYSPITRTINAQTGTTYTLVLGDDGDVVTMSNASANTLTVPTNASVAFAVGTQIDVTMLGAGVTTITGDTGVTVNGVSAGSGAMSAQYASVTLLKLATDTWLATGSIGTVA